MLAKHPKRNQGKEDSRHASADSLTLSSSTCAPERISVPWAQLAKKSVEKHFIFCQHAFYIVLGVMMHTPKKK